MTGTRLWRQVGNVPVEKNLLYSSEEAVISFFFFFFFFFSTLRVRPRRPAFSHFTTLINCCIFPSIPPLHTVPCPICPFLLAWRGAAAAKQTPVNLILLLLFVASDRPVVVDLVRHSKGKSQYHNIIDFTFQDDTDIRCRKCLLSFGIDCNLSALPYSVLHTLLTFLHFKYT